MLDRMARTTVRLDERLLARAKTYAAEHGRTFNSVMEDALRELLTRHERGERVTDEPIDLVTFAGDGLMPGVQIDSNAALLDLMDEGVPLDGMR